MSRIRCHLLDLDPLVMCALLEWRSRHSSNNPFRGWV
jgi:hypothetical protein